ncbi:TonB-dependent hemoglobin/transferrin/lactoferrin family receptor [Kaistia dalseonensis]|uniref:Hemoglobin/transferrin/lactoferrin receptor protein n=1 Tax=Kaistia dalseonensis TaxID=410840 RepID=A0ABU0H6J9_9HYPH|nr:TonB-dependent hemoglobin/transferrin/lactoferrin family receptor [Kaistia dalseonensis]MCX5495070.1 TonB-dependent hemoglobin/transferrin/lactoferrin family receptor [Kaistia dalseonensis]MDQ0437652.1 hemoglobin/transferrin/lactoferrin receptor protein [Kaistia dalseonensis]
MAGTTAALFLGMSAMSASAQQATATKTASTEKGTTTTAGATELQAVEVTATSGTAGSSSPAVTAKEGTAMVTTTTSSEITEKMIQSWDDFGKRAEPGVNYNDQNKSINVRGLDENNVVTTIDGIRIPYLGVGSARTGDGGGLSTFDFSGLSAIDVVRGADSSIAGSGAMGGLVALTTLSADDLLTEGRNFGFLTKNTYNSANQSITTSNAIAGRVSDTALLIQGSYSNGHETETQGTVGGYGSTRTEANPMDYDQYSLLGKLSQSFDGGHELTLTGETFKYDSTTDAMTSQSKTGNYRPGNYYTGEVAERQRVSLTYDYAAPEKGMWVDKAQAILYWQSVQTEADVNGYRYTSVIGPYVRENSNQIDEFGGKGFVQKDVQIAGYSNNFTVGGELFLTDTTQYSFGIDNCPANAKTSPCSMLHSDQADSPEAKGTTLAIYARDDIALTDQVTLTPGLRFDWYEQKPQETDGYDSSNPAYKGLPADSSGSKLSPSLLGTWKATEDLSFYAQWAQAFTAPTPGQLYLTYGGPGAYVSLGNPDLQAQEGSGYEAGLKYGDQALGGGLSIFNNYYKNFIDAKSLTAAEAAAAGYPLSQYPLGVTRYENIDSVRIYGIEARGNWEFAPHWKTWGSLAWMVGQNQTDNSWLDSVPPLKGIVGVGYSTEEWGSDVLVTAAAVNAQTSSSFNAPAYAVADWTVWWTPKQFKGLRLQGGVFNIFDATYFNALDVPTTVTNTSSNLDFYSEPGRNYRVNLTYQF